MFLILFLLQVCPGQADNSELSISLAHCQMHIADILGDLKGFVLMHCCEPQKDLKVNMALFIDDVRNN